MLIKDIQFKEGFQIGDQQCQLYTLSDVEDLPGLCGSRINYDKYSTDKTKFSIGFASAIGQLLPCNHLYNQYIFIEDAQKTIRKLESKRLRLQSLSAYSRENTIARDATNDFLNEAISQQRLTVKAHFNLLIYTDNKEEGKDLKNLVSSALAQMDASAKLETIKDHPILFPVVTIIIMEVFISKMRKLKGIRKMILIEEAWKAIAKEGMAQYIKYLFKTVRKHFGEAVVVTQEVEDIISSPVVKQAIINNSDCKILLDQSKYQNKFDQIQELLGLTEKEKALVLSVNKANDPAKKYQEVFISLGGMLSKVYRTEVSLEEYLAYTTEETEKVKVQEFTKKYGSVQKGISALAGQMRESI